MNQATIAYQGEPGAFSEEVSTAATPGAMTIGFETFDAAAHALESGDVDAACLPVENTLFGSIGRSYDLIDQLGLRIVESRILHVRQCLIARAAVGLDGIASVASHPVALEQCRKFFTKHPHLKGITTHDTAGAVRAMMDGSLAADACIAGEFAARRYGAHVVLHDIHDDPSNFTRFFILTRRADAHNDGRVERTHATIAAELANRPGTLRDALDLFADAAINLTNLVCRPIPSQPWVYRFFFEIEAGPDAANSAAAALSRLGKAHVCGCYATIAEE
jgi:prephenate dehydratase